MIRARHIFVILAYGESPYLKECIDSLKNQIVKSEIVMCTSTPNLFLEKMASQNNLKLIINPERGGIANDWSFALKKAEMKYVTLAHQDDIYWPEYSQEIITAGESRKDGIIIFSDYDEVVEFGNKKIIRKKTLNFFIKGVINCLFFKGRDYILKNKRKLLSLGNPIGCPTVAFNKSNIKDFKFDSSFSINMDWKAWYDLASLEGSFVRIKKTLVSHRIYPTSETSLGLRENRRQKEDQIIFEKFWPVQLLNLLTKSTA